MTQNSDSQQYKVSRSETRHGQDGQHHLVAGQDSSMRLWHNEQPSDTADKQPHANDYETLGYVISGSVELKLDGQTLMLSEGDSYCVPRGVSHTYRVTETLTAVEVTTPGQGS
ncbi:cupin domain-containing protein [Deinococcus humi]|uniref:Quercetin dioxygenase-like cupin family protein n=1 Tax=Deinococcus humi TaxID=662880 RepID=A0A7W8JU45_9DEIO|nr:cupin domain-containing protein [Deinococcus humi]MBB5361841.1 quercetin dioxygenase-like cupin family protein [Deinococcus humi]GGO23375.1 cupin [Deinococcus humi]